jgi:hypothetical protein
MGSGNFHGEHRGIETRAFFWNRHATRRDYRNAPARPNEFSCSLDARKIHNSRLDPTLTTLMVRVSPVDARLPFRLAPRTFCSKCLCKPYSATLSKNDFLRKVKM